MTAATPASRLALAASSLMIFAILSPNAAAADWPRWLGPNQNGSTTADGALSRPSLRLRKVWSHSIGGGRSGVVVADGRLFALVTDGETQKAIALDTRDGKVVWQVPVGPHVDASIAPVSTPAVDSGRVFVLGTDCILRVLSVADGAAAWQADLKQRFGSAIRRGCETSPFVENGRVVLQPGGVDDHRLVALDAQSGELVWSAKGLERANYSSPVAANIGGVRQVVVHHVTATPPQRSGLSGFRLNDGTLLWSRTFESNISTETPLVLQGDQVLLVTWNDAKLAHLKKSGETFEVEPVWTKPALRSRIAPPVHKEGYLYGFDGDDLVCLRAATGDVVWKQRVYAGSLILVDDALVVLSASGGVVRVVEAAPEGYRERALIEIFNRGAQAEAPPSFASGMIFVRNDEEIVAVAIER
jgi:outer membrane protein assembly factor BamB